MASTDEPIPCKSVVWIHQVVGHFGPTTNAVALALASLARGDTRRAPVDGARSGLDFYASGKTLRELSGAGQTSVDNATRELRRAGFLCQVSRGGMRGTDHRASVWRLILPTPVGARVGSDSQPSRDEQLEKLPNDPPRESWDASNTPPSGDRGPVDNWVPTTAETPPNHRTGGYQETVTPRETHHHSLPTSSTRAPDLAIDDDDDGNGSDKPEPIDTTELKRRLRDAQVKHRAREHGEVIPDARRL